MKITGSETAGRVLFANRYFHPDHSATSQLLGDLTSHLSQAGWQVDVVTSRQRYDDAEASLVSSETWGRVKIHRVWTSRFGRGNLIGRAFDYLSFYLMASLKLMQLTSAGSIIVAKTDPPLLGVPLSIVAKLKGATLVQWLQDVFPEVAAELGVGGAKSASWLLENLRNWSLRSSAVNVVLSNGMKERIEFSGAAFAICENWVTHPIDTDPGRIEGVRESLAVTPDHMLIGYSGNLGRAHDWKTLLEAASLLREDARFRFLIIGGGTGHAALRKEVEKRRLTSFNFLPYQDADSLSNFLAAVDVHWFSLLPELEGLIVPSKLYGILASARPVIYVGDAQSDTAAMIREFDCGFALSRGDSRVLADRLAMLAGSPDDRSRMGRNASSLYEAKFARGPALHRWELVLEAISREVNSRKMG